MQPVVTLDDGPDPDMYESGYADGQKVQHKYKLHAVAEFERRMSKKRDAYTRGFIAGLKAR